MLKTWAARHWAAHGTGPHGTGPHGTGPHGTGPKFFRDGAASGPSCHTPPCYLLRGTAALARTASDPDLTRPGLSVLLFGSAWDMQMHRRQVPSIVMPHAGRNGCTGRCPLPAMLQ